ncbi:MAG: DUF222 domain-containing protein [Actinomycetota bacterium]
MPTDAAAVGSLGDSELLLAQRKLGDIRRAVDECAALIAGEVGHRSRPALGFGGLAQREGFRTPEALVQHSIQSTSREASMLVQVGAIVREAMTSAEELGAPIREPWLAAVGAAVGAGSPPRGGPRFVSESDKTWADTIATDARSTEQYLYDALTELLRLAVGASTPQARAIVGSRQPSVRVLVTAGALDARTGHGRIEGCDLPISIETVERIACESGIQPITFSPEGRPLDVGREPASARHSPHETRVPVGRLRQATRLVRSAPHIPLGSRRRAIRHR